MSKQLTKKVFSQYKEPSLPLTGIYDFQKKSYDEFLNKKLKDLFKEFFPIIDSNERFKISFLSCNLESPRISLSEAKNKLISYSAPFKVQLELENKITNKKKKEEVIFGNIPIMTPQSTFIINGIERTIVTQFVRSNGVRFYDEIRGKAQKTFGAQVLPQKGKGVWIVFESDTNGRIFVRFDQSTKKMPVTTFIRAFGVETKEKVARLFEGDEMTQDVIKKTFLVDDVNIMDEVWTAFYKMLRAGTVVSPEKAKEFVTSRFAPDAYDLSEIGRINFNKRFNIPSDKEERNARHLRLEDIVLIVKEITRLNNTSGAKGDDIDNLGSRRVRTVGELVYEHTKIGFFRMHKNARDKMLTIDPKMLELPTNVLSLRTFQSTVHGFFNVNALSQVLKQQNILTESEHLRTVSAFGLGGVTRERANISVRDVHPTHYGRICPINSPEGGNVGLVLHLALYSRINEFGLLECPYFKVENGRVTDRVEYFTANEEGQYRISDASVAVDDNGVITEEEEILVRHEGQYNRISPKDVEYIDVATGQIFSIGASLVPFALNTLPVRSATGTKMQGQAIPCLNPESPLVATGYESVVGKTSGRVILAEESGEVIEIDANHITIKSTKGSKKYDLETFKLAGSAYSFANHQRPSVSLGQKVKKGDVIADVSSTVNGELAIGKNLRVAFIPYDGGTYEDAIIISERLVRDNVLTSTQVKEYTTEIRDTKLGPDVMTSDIPNVSEQKLRNLDADGVIRVGSEVLPGDILVGKLTPRGETQLTAEERLLQSIFGDKAKDMRDTSKVLPSGEKGKVVSIQIRSRDDGDSVDTGVIKQIRIIVAELRRICVGDKLANRYGNKGVISRIAPIEDMPFTADGEPVDIILSSLGVPSRKNLGQILEMHLGLAAHTLEYQAVIPPMTSITSKELSEEITKAGYPETGRVELFDGRDGNKFGRNVSVGWIYTMKLEHMVQNIIHARSTGKYTLITQQPPGGRANFGGIRLGEMEVWALLGHGAAHILREMLTIKSDDLQGRNAAYNSIIHNEPIRQSGTPAAFNVLLYYLRGLGLDISLNTSEKDFNVSSRKYSVKK